MTDATDNRRLIGRLVALGGGAVLVQVTAVSQIELFRATADLLPLVCAAVGLLLGSTTGAAFGFGVGFASDAASYETLGISSLALLAVGFGAGRVRELRDPQAPATPMIAGAAATLAVIFATGLMRFLLGMGLPFSVQITREALSTIVLGALVALPVFSVVRRFLQPVLPEGPRSRRRRSYTTGGLSPLSRS